MKLLLVEDQHTAANYLAKGLREEGFVIDIAETGPDGLHLLLTDDYALVILDVMLPGIDGFAILESIRRCGVTTPTLFLTARSTVEDRVHGLRLGADDYLVKPFAFSELLARLHVILRRQIVPAAPATRLTISDLELDLLKRQAVRAGIRIELTPKEFALLQLLMQRSGEVLSRTLLAEQVWGMHFESDTNAVDVAVRRLRAKVDIDFSHKLIHAQRGAGYVLEARA